MDPEHKSAFEKQLAHEGQLIAARQVKPKSLKPMQEIGTAKNRDVGSFRTRIGSAEWELDSTKAPRANVSGDCVGLPMGQYMEHQYERQHGKVKFAPVSEGVDLQFLDEGLQSFM